MVAADVGRAALLLVPAGALLGGHLAERIGLRGVMIASVLGGPLAFLVIWCSPVRGLLVPPERVYEGPGVIGL
jgi:MFS family permease